MANYQVNKTYQEINDKIKQGQAVVVTAEEIIDLVRRKGEVAAARTADVVPTGTFSPMCSSGAFINFGHAKPPIKASRVWLNHVPAYAGLAAVDVYLGATEPCEEDPLNKVYPGEFKYGGGHVIQDLVAGKAVHLVVEAYGTDCYPNKRLEREITLSQMTNAILCNPRNCYQNYNVAVNLSDKIVYTYMGMLKPKLGNANYCSAGQLSPLLNDPLYKTTGIGTRIFLGGGVGYVAWQGTQHNPTAKRKENGVPSGGAGTLAVIGDLKQMKPEWLVGTSFQGYGATLTVGIGIPIPVLNEEIAQYTAVKDEDIWAQVVDYSNAYPNIVPGSITEVNYAQLKSGKITVEGREVPTASLSSYSKAQEIAGILKGWVKKGKFLLAEPVAPIPGPESGMSFKILKEKPIG